MEQVCSYFVHKQDRLLHVSTIVRSHIINCTVVAESLLYFVIDYSYYEQVFCFAQFFLQILVNHQNQGQFQNLLVLRIPKLTLEVKCDQNLPELSKVKGKV